MTWILVGLSFISAPLVACYRKEGSLDAEATERWLFGLSLLEHMRLQAGVRMGGLLVLYGFFRIFV